MAETFAVAWRRLDDVPEPALPWLLGVARKVLANQRRGERRRDALAERLRAQPWRPAAEPEDHGVLRALAALGERDREVLLLHAWDGLDRAAAATVLGCTPNAFGVRLHRARRRLEAALRSEEVEVTR